MFVRPPDLRLVVFRGPLGVGAGSYPGSGTFDPERFLKAGFALSNEHRAHFWGIKAAQAGIPISSNPYASPRQRAAWEAGYRRNPDEERLAIPA